MVNVLISEIYSDGYERIMGISYYNQKLNVHLLEYDEYLENSEISKKRKIGDKINGDLFIDLVCEDELTTDKLKYYQADIFPHISAVVEVVELIDDYSVYVLSAICPDVICVEFEHIINYSVGDRIRLNGELRFEVLG